MGSAGGAGSTGVSPDSKQPQLLLMRVSSVKSSRSSDNESSNNNKRGAGKFTRINGRIYSDSGAYLYSGHTDTCPPNI